MNTHSNFSASCRDQKQPTLDDIIEIDGFNDMSLSERIAAMDKATVSAPLHVEANGNLTTPSLVPWEDAKPIEAALKARLRELVTVYEGPMNAFGREEKHSHPLSSGWLGRQTAAGLKAIVSSTSYFFREWCNVPTNRLAWTIMKEHRTSLNRRQRGEELDRAA